MRKDSSELRIEALHYNKVDLEDVKDIISDDLIQNVFVFFLSGTALAFASSAIILEIVRDKEVSLGHQKG